MNGAAESLLLAATEHIERQEREIERLQADKLGLELRASLAIRALEQRVAELEKGIDRISNYVQGLPQRAELDELRTQLSDISYHTPV